MLPLDGTSDFLALLQATEMSRLTRDLLVVGHLIALVIGIGNVIRVDTAMLRRVRMPIGEGDYYMLRRAHTLICLALVGLWATGLGLFHQSVGWEVSAASPKLAAKLLIVSWLSTTALAMSFFGIKIIRRNVGFPLLQIPLGQSLTLAVFAGLSLAGWSTALILGAAQTTVTAQWPALLELILGIHLATVGLMIVFMLTGKFFAQIARLMSRMFGGSRTVRPDRRRPLRTLSQLIEFG